MNHEDRDTLGMNKPIASNGGRAAVAGDRDGPGPHLMGANTLVGNSVHNKDGQDIGDIKEIMLDMRSGDVSYAVLAFGHFLGMGGKLFAVPWGALALDTENRCFVLNVDRKRLESAPGFDKDHWPDMADQTWAREVHDYYGVNPGGVNPGGVETRT